MTTMQDEMLDALESLIDEHGMVHIMLGLVHITDEKAEQVQRLANCNCVCANGAGARVAPLASAFREVSDALISKRLSDALNRLHDNGKERRRSK